MFLCVGGESEPTGLKSFSADQPSANTGKGKMEPVAAMSTGNNLSKNGGDVFETGEGAQHENCLFFYTKLHTDSLLLGPRDYLFMRDELTIGPGAASLQAYQARDKASSDLI